MCVCLSVHLSVTATEWKPNFQGGINSSQVFFGWVTQNQALAPKKGVSAKSLSSGALEQGGCVIPCWNQNNKAKKILGAEF